MNKEYIVVGCPRSGTSMVGGLLHILGVDMGTRLKDNKFEDLDILFQTPVKREKTIKENVGIKKIWGFKDPWVGGYLHIIRKHLKNPYFLYIKRNLSDAIKSDLNRNPKMENPEYPKNRNIGLTQLIEKALKNEKNVLTLYFDDAFNEPKMFINQIISFTGIQPDNDTYQKMLKFINKKGYKNLLK